MLNKIKTELFLNLKNLLGWRTNRKIVAFSVDDYGNVRVDSKQAREAMDKAGLKILSRFDAYDALENRKDLEMLFEVLSSVKDKNGNPAVFTPFAVPCNIDFERMKAEGYEQYQYELLPQTYQKLSVYQPLAYQGAWALWQEGIAKGLLAPQFHGREHLNLKVFEEKLAKRDFEVMTALQNRSYTSISDSGYPGISVTAAFEFLNFEENNRLKWIIEDGLNCFEKVFGYRAKHFNPPGGREHRILHEILSKNGIKYLNTQRFNIEHQGNGKYQKHLNYTGKKNNWGQFFLIKNCVFEPTETKSFDWVNFSLKQIEAAFRWSKPAIISSHRVNYCGQICSKNREDGIKSLGFLLKEILKKWPDVEFLDATSAIDELQKENKI